MASLRAQQEALLERLGHVQAASDGARRLAATAVEGLARWPERLSEVRGSEAWESAYAEVEPLVSVRIATWNRADALCERALSSVLAQSYDRWEAIVVGDACTDNTAERIAALGDPRISFHNRPYRGPYPDDPGQRWLVAGIPGMNLGAELAQGTWIAPQDDDDEWEPDHLELLVSAALAEQAELAYGRLRGVHHDPPITIEVGTWPPQRGDFGFQGAIYNAALREFRYDSDCRFLDEPGDWNLARRMWKAGVRFAFVDRVVTTWHVERGSESWFRERADG